MVSSQFKQKGKVKRCRGANVRDDRQAARINRLLRALGQGGRIVRCGDSYHLNGSPVGGDEIRALQSRDLVSGCENTGYGISDIGRMRLKRLLAERSRAAAAKAGDSQALAVHAPYRDQHQDVVRAKDPGGSGNRVRWVNRAESPLGWLRRRRDGRGRPLISAEQMEAGERLRVDFELAGLSPRVTARWDGMPANQRKGAYRDLDPTEVQIAARTRFSRVMKILGPGLADVAVHTCCLLEGLEDCERRLGWPPRSAKVVLGLALDRLVEHYGIGKKHHNGKI